MPKYEAEIHFRIEIEAASEQEADQMLIDRIAPEASVEDDEFIINSIVREISEIKYQG